MKKTYYFTCSKANRILISPSKGEFDNSRAIQSKNGGLITVPDTFTMDFTTGVWTTRDISEVKIIRNNKNYGSLIFETDKDGKDLTKDIIEKMEGVEDAVVSPSEPANPYKLLPEAVLNKMSIPELKAACDSIKATYLEETAKKDLIKLLVK